MIRYTVKLTKAEVEELHSIINKGSHTSQTGLRNGCMSRLIYYLISSALLWMYWWI